MPVKLNSTGGGSVTLTTPSTATDYTATFPANTGNVVTTGSSAVVTQAMLGTNVAGNGPAFSAYQSSAQSLSAATNTKITFTTEDFDTNNLFASSRFTPNVAGYYLFTCGVRSDTASISALHAKLAKNGSSEFAAGSFSNTTFAAFMSTATGIVYLNGTTDYVEVYAYSGSSITLATGASGTYFQGVLVRAA
jgi:hypothetical protein